MNVLSALKDRFRPALAALVADPENYPLIKPLIEQMRKKYPQYEPTDAVKNELQPAVDQWIKPR